MLTCLTLTHLRFSFCKIAHNMNFSKFRGSRRMADQVRFTTSKEKFEVYLRNWLNHFGSVLSLLFHKRLKYFLVSYFWMIFLWAGLVKTQVLWRIFQTCYCSSCCILPSQRPTITKRSVLYTIYKVLCSLFCIRMGTFCTNLFCFHQFCSFNKCF